MFKLLRYFTITSLIAFIIAATYLGLYYRDVGVNDLVVIGENRNITLTQAFSNSIWPDYAAFLSDVPSDFESQALMNDPTIQMLNQDIRLLMQETPVVKVKIYNLSGKTLFSTEAAQIGEDKSDNAGFLAAKSGEVISELTHRDMFSAFEGEIENLDVLSSYIPIRGNPEAPVEGVFELYTDVTPLLSQIEATQRNLISAVALGLGLLYFILFFIVRRADQILREQYQERQRTAENLQAAKEAAEIANHSKTEFISFVSHELRTPMTAAVGYLSLVGSGKVGELNEKQETYIQRTSDNLDRMNQLVSDLSDISLLETNHFRLEMMPVDALETVNETAAAIQNQINQKQQDLKIEATAELPQILADRLRLVQILSNLIGNASKYTPVGGSIVVGLAPVQNGRGQVIQFSVKDNGMGIGDNEKEQIFQKFFRSANQETANIPGTGIGLNLTHQLVNLHDGEIWFESELNQGSTFYFTIPAV